MAVVAPMTRSAKASPLRNSHQAAYSWNNTDGYPREKQPRDDRKLRPRKACKGGRFNPDMTRRRFFGKPEDDQHEISSPEERIPLLPWPGEGPLGPRVVPTL